MRDENRSGGMTTEIITVDRNCPDATAIERAGAMLRAGKTVAFPTETVYGLGANALDAGAVAEIFEAKGRPVTNPLIVHIADLEQLPLVAAEFPEKAKILAETYFPGPLTLILPKTDAVPLAVTAGGPSVGVRMPAHPVARAIIRAAGVPVAAPSANRFTEISPTTAAHVQKSLGGRIAAIVDGGPTSVGIESTVLDLTTEPPTLWRAGMISRADLEALIGPVSLPESKEKTQIHPSSFILHPSPGQHFRHYAPRARVHLVGHGDRERLMSLFSELNETPGGRAACIAVGGDTPVEGSGLWLALPDDPTGYAERIYATLHNLDDAGATDIIIENVPDTPAWAGLSDRLARASR